jgi:hypothetical protein
MKQRHNGLEDIARQGKKPKKSLDSHGKSKRKMEYCQMQSGLKLL